MSLISLQTEEAFTVKEYKHTHTHARARTHTHTYTHTHTHARAQDHFFQKSNIFQKSDIPHYLLFLESYHFWAATFSKDVIFYRSYLFSRVTFSFHTFSEKLLFHSYASFPNLNFLFIFISILNLVIKWAQYQLRTVKVWEFFLVYVSMLKVTS